MSKTKVVPIEPSEEMVEAALQEADRHGYQRAKGYISGEEVNYIWRSMLEAVASRPAVDEGVGEAQIEAAAKVIYQNIDDVAVEMMGPEKLKAFARVTAEEALRAALSARGDKAGWQPIETAPKDGTRFLAASKHAEGPMIVSWWSKGEISGFGVEGSLFMDGLTHWQLLPKQPVIVAQASGKTETKT